MDTTQAKNIGTKIGNAVSEALTAKEERKEAPRSSKKEELLKNEQARQELIAKDQPKATPVSRDIDIDYPLTSPAEKARLGRVDADANAKYGKPHPVGSNLAAPATTATDPAPQTEKEFKATGGEGFGESADIKPDTSKEKPLETDNVTDKEAKERDEKLEAARKEATSDNKKAADKK